MCLAATAETAKEDTVADTAETRTFTEAEHFALLTDAVRRETAEIASEKEALLTEKADLQGRVDVLEAEKAALVGERDAVQAEFDGFKAELAEKAEIESRTEDRVKAMKAAADHLPDDYFTAERASRWASMDDTAFETALADLTATKPAKGVVPETAAFRGGSDVKPAGQGSQVGSFFAHLRGDK